MNNSLKKFMLLATTIFGGAVPALAQEASGNSNDIVVTARRVEERLQDVPISISVLSQEQLTNQNISSAGDLATFTPSLSTNKGYGSNNSAFSLRGFGQELQTSPSVAVYFADAVAPRGGAVLRSGDGAGPGSFFDLENVQVLKGPQGTLFGRNTTGGAILIVPKKPTSDVEGYLEGSYGSYNMERLQGVINLPVSDSVRLRLGLDQQTRDGYVKNISGIGPKRFNDIDYIAARVSLVVDITSDIENYTIGTFARSNSNGDLSQLYSCNPAAGPFGQTSCEQLARNAGKGKYSSSNSLKDPESYLRQWQAINTTKWTASDTLTIKNTFAIGEIKNRQASSLFGDDFRLPAVLFGVLPTGPLAGTPVPFLQVKPPPGENTTNQQTLSEELQFQGSALDSRLRWQAGLYYEHSKSLGEPGVRSAVFLNCTNPEAFQCTDVLGPFFGAPLGAIQQQTSTITFNNYGIYEQASYDLTDKLTITEGLRYTVDKVEGFAHRLGYTFATPNVPVVSCFSGDLTLQNNCAQSTSVTPGQGNKAPTWMIDLEYKPTGDALIYAKYSRGYRQGSLTQFGAIGHLSFKPERVDAYELGAKVSFRGSVPGNINAALFYNDLSNQQLQASFNPKNPGDSQAAGILNAGKSRIWGVEVAASVSPVKGLTLDGAYTYLNTKLLSIDPFVPNPLDKYAGVQFGSAVGKPLALSPKHKFAVSASYKLPLDPELGNLNAAVSYAWQSSQANSDPTPLGSIASYGLMNLNLNWRGVGGQPIDIEFFMTNVLNKFYAAYSNNYAPLGFASRVVGEPRMSGVRFRVHLD